MSTHSDSREYGTPVAVDTAHLYYAVGQAEPERLASWLMRERSPLLSALDFGDCVVSGARFTVIVMLRAAAARLRVVSVALVPPDLRRATEAWFADMRAARSRCVRPAASRASRTFAPTSKARRAAVSHL